MEPIILFRKDHSTASEFDQAKSVMPVSETRMGLTDRLVIGRYSVLPYYAELEKDLVSQGSRLINTHTQHQYIADFEYYHDVAEWTPQTWFEFKDIPEEGPFVVKGRTNSRKFEWNRRMFAKNRHEAIQIGLDLDMDGLIHGQGIIVRKFVPLKVLEYGINGLPFSNEWRFFYLGTKRLTHAFYWTLSEKRGEMNSSGLYFADKMAAIIAQRANFFVLDIAEKADGGWTLIEVNDAQMSGLSGNDPKDLYEALLKNLG